MKKTLQIDEETLQQVKEACGAPTETETIQLVLETLIRHSASQRLRTLRGSEKSPAAVPRRRSAKDAAARHR